jgi:hypothetical protein
MRGLGNWTRSERLRSLLLGRMHINSNFLYLVRSLVYFVDANAISYLSSRTSHLYPRAFVRESSIEMIMLN